MPRKRDDRWSRQLDPRQLGKAPKDLRVEVRFARTKETTALLLDDALKEPKALLSPSDSKREPRSSVSPLPDLLAPSAAGRAFLRTRDPPPSGGLLWRTGRRSHGLAPKAPKLSSKEIPGRPKIQDDGAGVISEVPVPAESPIKEMRRPLDEPATSDSKEDAPAWALEQPPN